MSYEISGNNKKIVKNTLFLYFRMLIVMGVSLYTSRVVLNALGVQDFGLYGVIGGVVALFSIVSGSLSAAISRFLTYELGNGDQERISQVFSTSLYIQILMVFIVTIILVPAGIWFISSKMEIPDDNYMTAYWVYGFSVATFCINLLSVPYNAAIISHERMSIYAYVSILDVVLKLTVAFLITTITNNRLIYYACFLFIGSFIIQITYIFYCKKKFSECSSKARFQISMVKEIGAFAGWNTIGAASGILSTQGINVLLNLFFGTVINAAYGIANQVKNAITQLSDNFLVAVNPQIIKYYAQKNYEELNKLIIRSSRMAFYLTWILSILIMTNSSYILSLWLKNVPEGTVLFVNLILVYTLLESISKPLITSMLATGNIRKYQVIVGGIQLLNIPVSYIGLKYGAAPRYVMWVLISVSISCLITRLILLRQLFPFDRRHFLGSVMGSISKTVIISLIIPIIIYFFYGNAHSLISLIWESGAICIWTAFTVLFVGCNKGERDFIIEKIIHITH